MSYDIDRIRPIARKPTMYIDVLHISNIPDAVHQASIQLRQGILHAMSTNASESSSSALSNVNINNQPETNTVARDDQSSLLSSTHPVPKRPRKQLEETPSIPSNSVYASILPTSSSNANLQQQQQKSDKTIKTPTSTALNTRPSQPKPKSQSKPNPSSASASTSTPSTTPSVSPKPTSARAWNRDKKAGPSILSKRQSPDSVEPSPQSKRERRVSELNSTATTDPYSTISSKKRTQVTAPPLSSKKPSTTTSSTGSTSNKSKIDITKKNTIKPTASAKNSAAALVAALKRTDENKITSSGNGVNHLHHNNSSKTEDDVADSIETVEGALAAMAAATVKKENKLRRGMTLSTALGGPLSTPSSVASSATMSQLRKKMGTSSDLHKTSNGGSGSGGSTKITAAQQQAYAQRGGINGSLTKKSPTAIPASTTSKAKSISPTPNSVGSSGTTKEIQYIPGCKDINGVKPNGYMVSERGVVKPVVTFTQRPKVPMKFRQTVLEKMFSVWKDERKVADATALQKSLLSEQEIYAKSAGRVEYRAATVSKMKDIRNGNG